MDFVTLEGLPEVVVCGWVDGLKWRRLIGLGMLAECDEGDWLWVEVAGKS